MGNVLDELKVEAQISEAYLASLFWNKPLLYDLYPEEKLNRKTFLNEVWGFYFGLGRYMYERGISVFDDIAVAKFVSDLKIQQQYEEYGEYETINELMKESKEKEDNIEGIYEDVKKYDLLRSLVKLFGTKVLQQAGNYNHKEMTRNQLYLYWHDKINQLGISGDVKFDERYLLENLEEAIDDWDENPMTGLPFYKSRQMNRICPGIVRGNSYILGSNSGRGKTSISCAKVILSCIEQNEKLLVIANEMNVKFYQQLLLISAMGVGTREGFDRNKIQKGKYTSEEKEKLKRAAQWVKNMCGDGKLITFVFMENYIMSDVEKIIRYYAARGIKYVMIDTSKVSQNAKSEQRWAAFGDDYRRLYELAREDGGGLNLGIWTTVQLAPSALKMRFLNENALAEFKGITREASVVMLTRSVWEDEYQGGNKELIVTRWKKDPTEESKYIKEEFKLEKGDQYHLLFTVKNRLGMDINSGQQILVLKPNFNSNIWEEVGWTWVYDDKNY